jgi:Ligand-gated ion channel
MIMWLLLFIVAILSFVHGQQSPTIFVDKFDTSKIFRTNVCDRQRQIWNGSIAFADALRGLNLTVVLTDYQYGNAEDEFFSLVDGKISEDYPGLFGVMIDEVARRAGFEWRNSFGTYSPLDIEKDVNKTWTDILLWGVEVFDISVEVWGKSLARQALGVSFPTGWYDSSATFVEHITESEQVQKVVNIWAFLDPFSYSVWLAIMGFILITGLVLWLLEYMDIEADELLLHDNPLLCIFHTAIVFTGHLGTRPRSHGARILSLSWTFWALIVISAYTANLASYMVSPQVAVFHINSVQAALELNASVCVQQGAVVESILKVKYPELKLIGKQTESEIFDALRLDTKNGGCDAAVHQLNSVRVYERNKLVNYDCALSSDLQVAENIPAGMATSLDTGRFRCTSLISAVLDFYLLEMLNDGFVEEAWIKHMSRVGTIECLSAPLMVGIGLDDGFSLRLQDVGGVFIFHFMMSVLSLLVALVQYFRSSSNRKRSILEVFGRNQAQDVVNRSALTVVDLQNFNFTQTNLSSPRLGEGKKSVSFTQN